MKRAQRASILVVEDNVPLATCLEMLLESQGFEAYRTGDGYGALQNIKLRDFDIILCDLVMPGLSGYQLHAEVRGIKPHLCDRFLFMSGYPQMQASAVSTGRPILHKPFATDILLAAIDDVVRQKMPKADEMGPSDTGRLESPTTTNRLISVSKTFDIGTGRLPLRAPLAS